MMSRTPKVFISYSHEAVAHQERVLALADRLRADGIDADIDQYNDSPPEGWPAWCERQIDTADLVLVVCTETYHRRVKGEEQPGTGLGVIWEAAIIRQLLYDAGAVSRKFVPVIFSDGSPTQIPRPVKGWSYYVVDTDEGYESLYRRLTQQPELPRPALGPLRTLPARNRRWSGRWSEEARPAPPPAPAAAADRPAEAAQPAPPREAPRLLRKVGGRRIATRLSGGLVALALAAWAAAAYVFPPAPGEQADPVAARGPEHAPAAKQGLTLPQEPPQTAEPAPNPPKPGAPSGTASARSTNRSPSCAHILQRLQLGETVSNRDRSYLRESCR
ncbi:MAG: TIR domain-containing protein [Rhodospirillales bacterium]|nr:TIR domain-containing protein [Rhodospirillales bacterium]